MSSRLSVGTLSRSEAVPPTSAEPPPSHEKADPGLYLSPHLRFDDPLQPVRGALRHPEDILRGMTRGGKLYDAQLLTMVSDRLARDLIPTPLHVIQVGADEIDKACKSGRLASKNGPPSIAPALQIKIYKPSDAIVKKDPLRNWLTADGAAWIDTSGVLEAKKHTGVALPLGNTGLVGQTGIDASSLLQYRSIMPYELGMRSVDQFMQWSQLQIPNSATRASRMPMGGEFALRGSGSVSGHSSISGGPLGEIGSFDVGVGAKASAVIKYRGDFELDVLRLADEKVRVTLRRSAISTQALGSEILAGVANARGTLPGWGEGLLLRLMQFSGSKLLVDAVKKYGSLRCFTGAEDGVQWDNESHFVFDLSIPAAAQAYESVFSLDFAQAEQLAMVNQYGTPSGVSCDRIVTTTQYDMASRLVTVLGAKILLTQTLYLESEGVHYDLDGNRLLTRRSLLRRQYQDIARGRWHLDWQVVQARRPDGHYEPFFHLTYQHTNKITLPQQVEALFRFADALGDKSAASHRDAAQAALDELCKQSWAKKLFSGKDNTETDMDLYFTGAGISHIARATEHEIFCAYVTAMSKLDGAMARMPLMRAPELATPMLKRMAELNQCWWWSSAQAKEAHDIGERYTIMFERCIDDDAEVYMAATQVSDRVVKLRQVLTYGSEEARGKAVSHFFMDLGKRLGYKFTPVIATLAQLAGEHGTLVHKLALSGAGIHFASCEGGPAPELPKLGKRVLRFRQNR